MSLYSDILALSPQPMTKSEIVDYYQGTYKGRGAASWRQQLIQDLVGIRGTTRDDAEYQRQAKNMARRFDPSRLHNPEPRNAEEYRLLGESLPHRAPEGGFLISGTIWVKYSPGPCEPRDIDPPIHITPADAKTLVNMAADEMIQAVANAYQNDQDEDGAINAKGPDWCAEPELYVEAIE